MASRQHGQLQATTVEQAIAAHEHPVEESVGILLDFLTAQGVAGTTDTPRKDTA